MTGKPWIMNNIKLGKINISRLSSTATSSQPLSPKSDRSKIMNNSGSKAYLSGVVGYNTPIVPVIELGLLLTINRRFDIPKDL